MDIPITNALLTFCEEDFECEDGEPRAYMEFPHPDAKEPIGPDDIVRVIYVVYAVSGPDFDDCEEWMVDKVLMPLVEKAGQGAHLYWRKKFLFEALDRSARYLLRVRIGVLDKDYKPVEIEDAMKPEGKPCHRTEDG